MTQSLHLLRRKQIVVICVLLFGSVVWTFLPALHNGFINYDDDVYVTGNVHVQKGLSPATVAWAFESTDASNWHPLTWLSHMTDCEFFGLNPQGHHFTSVLLHAINAVLLFLALRRMTGAAWRSLFVAAVFGLHPLRVESVAWVAERKDVLSTMFGLVALLMYAQYVERSRAPNPRLKVFYGLVLVFFALSLMSKPMLVTLPFFLLLLDYWPLNRFRHESAWKLVREKVPLFFLAAASCVVTYVVQKHGGAMELMAEMPFTARLENVPVSFCRYLGKLFWPENLTVIYPVVDHWPMTGVLLAAALLLGVSAASIAARRSHPYLAVGWFWFLGTLVPVIGLVAVGEQSMADRYTYFPLIGVLVVILWGAEEMTRRWRYQTAILSVMSAAIIVTCILLTRQNIIYWKTSETLFRHALAVTSDNYSAHCNLGNALTGQGRLIEALVEFQTAAKLKPGSSENHCNVGVALANMDLLDEAIVEFQSAASLNPDNGLAHHNLGMALERKDQLDQATHEYKEAVRLMPGYAPAHNSLGVAMAKKGRLDDAVTQFQEAIRLDPSNLPAQGNLKMALELKGH
ncbi:MAG: tetratricopeptide repeat protein [Verrucomicrobiales bacterium]|nr:tetratricopeptide repeat protein [Verrucomicrobiales bacterium]